MATSRKKVKEAAGSDYRQYGRAAGYDSISVSTRSGTSPRAPKGSKKKTTHKTAWNSSRASSKTGKYGKRRAFTSHSARA